MSASLIRCSIRTFCPAGPAGYLAKVDDGASVAVQAGAMAAVLEATRLNRPSYSEAWPSTPPV